MTVIATKHIIVTVRGQPRALFHKTLKTFLHGLAGLCKDVFMFYETEPRVPYSGLPVILAAGERYVFPIYIHVSKKR